MGKNPKLKVLLFLIFFILIKNFCVQMVMGRREKQTIAVGIGAAVDVEDEWVDKIGLSCVQMALSDFSHTHPHFKIKFLLHSIDMGRNGTVLAAIPALKMIKDEETQAIIIGSTTSAQTNFIIELGEKARVPVISFSESFYSKQNLYFIKATRSDAIHQMKAISEIIQAFKWGQVVPIYVDNDYGWRLVPHLSDSFLALGINVPHWTPISPSATDAQVRKVLAKLKAMPARVFVVHMFPDIGSRLFTIAKELEMMNEGYAWILTDGMTNFLHLLDPSVIDSMQGALGVKPYVPKTKALKDFELRWKMRYYQDDPDMVATGMNIHGLLAYDATTALAHAIEQSTGSTRNGSRIIQALHNISFRGLTGDVLFVNEQLQPSVLQVVNVDDSDNMYRGVGCWTPEEGLVSLMPSRKSTSHDPCNTSKRSNIVWPGDSNSVPGDSDYPVAKRKMKIVVPEKNGFRQFVNVTKVISVSGTPTNYNITGFCIELFECVFGAVIKGSTLDYHVSNKSYDDMVKLVADKEYDIAVGDVTFTGDRSMTVDFTLPYMISGVFLIVPTKERVMQDRAWEFLKPLTWQLWVTTIGFFIYVAFVVWVLEHRNNEEFQGPTSRQLGASFWFSFSTMFLAHRERVVSNLTKTVVIICCFVGLILTQSYTASLTAYLALKHLTPLYDMDELVNHNVGFQKGAFVGGVLKELGFAKLIEYSSAEDCHNLLSNGSIIAAFDELPYANLILGHNPHNYTKIDPFTFKTPYWKNVSMLQKFRTNGIGFVFPKGSRLAPQISTSILKFLETSKFKNLEEYWFGYSNYVNELDNESNRLGLSNFIGLFLVAGTVSFLALIIDAAMFVCRFWQVVMPPNSETSVWNAICHLLSIFNQTEGEVSGNNRNQNSDVNLSLSNVEAPHKSVTDLTRTSSSGEQEEPSSESPNPNLRGQTSMELISQNQEMHVTSSETTQENS